jgi:glycosyltransferase involved in cell wall biosynthesis
MDVRPSFMQHLPGVARHHQAFLPVFPFAFESLDLRPYDVVLSMSSAWSKNVLTRPETCHVCYCLTPMRFGWSFEEYVSAGERVFGWQRRLLQPILTGLRLWDAVGANRVDHFAAISNSVARRIKKYYRREAAIIAPPVETGTYRADEPDEGYFLVVARLIPYKRVDLAVQACSRLGMRLKIIGDGRDRPRLEALAGGNGNVEFLGWVDEATKRHYLEACRGFIFAAEEDFGIAPVEAMAAGRPVIAYGAGGALDTVVDGMTGVFFGQQSPAALAAALERASTIRWDRAAIAAQAARFDVATFKDKLRQFVEDSVASHRSDARLK